MPCIPRTRAPRIWRNDSAPTAVRRMVELKAFFEYCCVRDAKDREPQKRPFTDDELKKMYESCHACGGTYRHH